MKTHKDIKYEIAQRDEQVHRLKDDVEQLQEHLRIESKEKQKADQDCLALADKVNQLTTKNTSLQQQIFFDVRRSIEWVCDSTTMGSFT